MAVAAADVAATPATVGEGCGAGPAATTAHAAWGPGTVEAAKAAGAGAGAVLGDAADDAVAPADTTDATASPPTAERDAVSVTVASEGAEPATFVSIGAAATANAASAAVAIAGASRLSAGCCGYGSEPKADECWAWSSTNLAPNNGASNRAVPPPTSTPLSRGASEQEVAVGVLVPVPEPLSEISLSNPTLAKPIAPRCRSCPRPCNSKVGGHGPNSGCSLYNSLSSFSLLWSSSFRRLYSSSSLVFFLMALQIGCPKPSQHVMASSVFGLVGLPPAVIGVPPMDPTPGIGPTELDALLLVGPAAGARTAVVGNGAVAGALPAKTPCVRVFAAPSAATAAGRLANDNDGSENPGIEEVGVAAVLGPTCTVCPVTTS
mmetsp:Transcript_147040/g.472176  ORF Transcript_147040/g.472176 Transcript_147040/m.472176 type:complete len:377 (-) Transcript_147040:2048-3178(-)